MSNLVIVAIPDENDRVWKVSSEKVPHLTLLFLGDSDQVGNLDKIVEFTEHAANTSLRRFYLPVDRRGELGNDPDLGPADVLFFKKGRYDYKAIRDFRAALLQDHNIRKAYDAATQHEGPWMPHLTLGYEKRPANPDPTDRDYGFYDVAFTKIAVWVDDFDGPEFLLKDYWDEWDALETVPMDVAMSALHALSHAETVSDTKWSSFKDSDYDDQQWAKACLLDRGADKQGKARYGLPVREPDGTLNRNGCHAAAAVLSSVGGTGKARGNKLQGSDEAIAKAKKRLVALYKGPLDEDVPEGLGGEKKSEMQQTADRGVAFLEHYGVKGMKWGTRNDKGGSNTSGVGETKREGAQKFLDPQGHSLSRDITKTALGVVAPIVAPLTWPAQIRLIRGGARGVKAKALDSQEKKFVKNAMSPKNFVAIHNGSLGKANRDIDALNKKYPDLSKPATKKKYDDEVLKAMQNAYKESANSLVNKANTHHLDVEFKNDGKDFVIHAKQGPGTPQPKRVAHAADDLENEEITVEITGKIKRDASGYIVGLVLDDLEQVTAAQHAVDLGATLVATLLDGDALEHYGVKGMRWGVRKERTITTTTHTDTGILRRRTRVRTKGGQSAPAHHDAVKAAVAKQLVKKSGTDALSTQELRDLANRLQVENQVQVLMSSKGKNFVKGQLESEGKQAVGRGIKKAAPHVIKRASKTAAGAAATAALL